MTKRSPRVRLAFVSPRLRVPTRRTRGSRRCPARRPRRRRTRCARVRQPWSPRAASPGPRRRGDGGHRGRFRDDAVVRDARVCAARVLDERLGFHPPRPARLEFSAISAIIAWSSFPDGGFPRLLKRRARRRRRGGRFTRRVPPSRPAPRSLQLELSAARRVTNVAVSWWSSWARKTRSSRRRARTSRRGRQRSRRRTAADGAGEDLRAGARARSPTRSRATTRTRPPGAPRPRL